MIRAINRSVVSSPVWLVLLVVMVIVAACGEEEAFPTRQVAGGDFTADPTTTVAASNNEADPTATALGPDAGLDRDAAMYAEDQGISVEEALERFKMNEDFGPLNGTLEANERETFAGAFLQHEPEYRFVVLFTRDGEETIRKYVEEGSELDAFVEVREARFSLAELQEIRAEADSVLAQLDHAGPSSAGNVKENRIEYYVHSAEQVHQMLADAGLELPEGAVLLGDGPPVSYDPPEEMPGIYIAIQKPGLGSGAQMEAEFIGELVLLNGCIFVQPDHDNELISMPIWPYEFHLQAEGDEVEVVNSKGEVVARVGDPIYMGGGGIGFEHIGEESLHYPVPDDCWHGGVWMVGHIDPLDEQLVIPTPVVGGAPLDLHTVQWPGEFNEVEAIVAALPETLGDPGLPRWNGPTESGRIEVGYGNPDEPGRPRLTITDLTTGDPYPDYWTASDLIASRFTSTIGMSTGGYEGMSWATEDTAESGWADRTENGLDLHWWHWGSSDGTVLFSASAADEDLLEQLLAAVVGAGGE